MPSDQQERFQKQARRAEADSVKKRVDEMIKRHHVSPSKHKQEAQ